MKQRRMMPRSIAKVNAKSIEGFFGIGTSCFFIRGTILSDTPLNGDYPSLNFMRPGNVIEIASFDGVWAVVTIRTRAGNRPGDNVTAVIYLRDDDLKSHGVDCTRIANLNGLPFSFDVESLTADGLFSHNELEPYSPIEDDPDPPPVEEPVAVEERMPEPVAYIAPEPEPEPPQPEPEPEPEPIPEVEPEPEPLPEFDPQPEPVQEPQAGAAPVSEPPAALRPVGEPAPAFTATQLAVGVGATVAVVAVPVLIYMALNRRKKSSDDDAT